MRERRDLLAPDEDGTVEHKYGLNPPVFVLLSLQELWARLHLQCQFVWIIDGGCYPLRQKYLLLCCTWNNQVHD